MRPVHVDMAEIEAVLAKAKIAMELIASDNGSRGAQARMSIVVDHAFSRQMAVEINRNTSAEDLSDALAAVCSNMISGFVDTLLAEDASTEDRMALVDCQLYKTARFISQKMSGQAEKIASATVRTQEGGHA